MVASLNFSALRQESPWVLPSMLLCDFGNLEREVRKLEDAGAPALHLDVMDGVFVPNMTYGMTIVDAIRKLTTLPLDVHLMIANPGEYVGAFADAGSDVITFHVEAVEQPGPILQQIRDRGIGAGVVLNPETRFEAIQADLNLCDLVLVMSVKAGFGGQAFQPQVLDKVRQIRQAARPETLIEIDGGINLATIKECAEAGVDWFVVGSGIFRSDQHPEDYAAAIRELTDLARE